MPAERTIMRPVREVLRLKFVGGVPIREIARRIGVAASTVRATIRRFQAAGLSWPLPDDRLVTSRYDPVGPRSTAMTHPLLSTGFRPRGWSRLCFAGHNFLRSEGLLCLFASAQVIHRQSTPLSVCSTPRTTSRPASEAQH